MSVKEHIDLERIPVDGSIERLRHLFSADHGAEIGIPSRAYCGAVDVPRDVWWRGKPSRVCGECQRLVDLEDGLL